DAVHLALPVVNLTTNIPAGNSDNYTWEVAATRRQSSWWSLLGSLTGIWSRAEAVGTGTSFTPNALINTRDGINRTMVWQAKITGTLNVPMGVSISPVFRIQAGQAYGRTFTQSLNFGPAA